jgi:hypothetical protein
MAPSTAQSAVDGRLPNHSSKVNTKKKEQPPD